MRVVAFTSRKGGSGKSSLAAHCAIHADRDEPPALLVDTDEQGSLSFWHSLREAATPVLVKCPPTELASVLADARADGVKWCLVDSAPTETAGIAAVMRLADLAVIPTRAAAFDLAAVSATVEMARAVGRKALVVLNAVPPGRGGMEAGPVAEARAILASMGAAVWSGTIVNRAAIGYAVAEGRSVEETEPAGPAAQEIADLWRAIRAAVEE